MTRAERRARNAVAYFERSVDDKAFQGQYPRFSDCADEQKQLDAIHRRIEYNYTRSRNALLKLLGVDTP